MFMDSTWINLDPVETDSPARDLYNGGSQEGIPRCRYPHDMAARRGSAPKNVPISLPVLPEQSILGSLMGIPGDFQNLVIIGIAVGRPLRFVRPDMLGFHRYQISPYTTLDRFVCNERLGLFFRLTYARVVVLIPQYDSSSYN